MAAERLVVPWKTLPALDLLGRVAALGQHCSVVDWGCGLNHSPVSCQVRDLECDLLLSVDAWPDYLATIRQQSYRARVHEYHLGDVLGIMRFLLDEGRACDLSLCLDIVEHLEQAEAERFLRGLQQISRAILIWIPLGYAPIAQDSYGGSNHFFHTHRSTWEAADLERLGFAVEVLPDFHTAMFGWPVAAGWACWQEGERK